MLLHLSLERYLCKFFNEKSVELSFESKTAIIIIVIIKKMKNKCWKKKGIDKKIQRAALNCMESG